MVKTGDNLYQKYKRSTTLYIKIIKCSDTKEK